MRLLNKTVICKPIEQTHSIIIYSDETNKKCQVVHSDPNNRVKPGDEVIIDPRVAIQYDSDSEWYYIHEHAIKAVIK
jgi:hypothetical protein